MSKWAERDRKRRERMEEQDRADYAERVRRREDPTPRERLIDRCDELAAGQKFKTGVSPITPDEFTELIDIVKDTLELAQ